MFYKLFTVILLYRFLNYLQLIKIVNKNIILQKETYFKEFSCYLHTKLFCENYFDTFCRILLLKII